MKRESNQTDQHKLKSREKLSSETDRQEGKTISIIQTKTFQEPPRTSGVSTPSSNLRWYKAVVGLTFATVLISGLGIAPADAAREKEPTEKPSSASTMEAPLIRKDMTGAQWQIAGVGATEKSESGKTADGRGIIVAVIADGVDTLHPDLQGATVTGWDAAKSKPFTEGLLHTYGSSGTNGTFQATIIAGTNDNKGVRGIAPQAKVMPIVVADEGSLSDETVASGIQWAVKAGAKILTLSLGVSEGTTSEKAEKTCSAISAARKTGVLTFVPAVNDELMSEASFSVAHCTAAIAVTAVGENLSNRLNRKITAKPHLSAPGYDVVGGSGGGSNVPYMVASSTLWSTATAAGAAAALWSAFPSLTAEQLEKLLFESSTEIGDASTYGAGLVDVQAALAKYESGTGRRTAEQRRTDISRSSVPVVVDANRGGDGQTSLTWLPPFNTTVENYLVVVSRWSPKNQKWMDTTSIYDKSTVRAVISGELNDDAFATVIAVTQTGERKSVPVNNTWYNPAQPTFMLDADTAAVLQGTAKWIKDGIEVNVEVNDPSRPWMVIIIDPKSGEQVKKMNVSAGKTRHVIKVGQLDDLRNRPLLVAAGMGRNGVDMNVQPQYGLKVSVLPVGKNRAGITGEVTCTSEVVNNCGSRDLVEGTEVQVLDAKSKKVLTTAIVRSDRSFSAVWIQKSSSYDVVVVGGTEKSMRYNSSFFVR